MLKFLQRIQRDLMSHIDSISASLGVPLINDNRPPRDVVQAPPREFHLFVEQIRYNRGWVD
jgi:hypothetical protein